MTRSALFAALAAVFVPSLALGAPDESPRPAEALAKAAEAGSDASSAVHAAVPEAGSDAGSAAAVAPSDDSDLSALGLDPTAAPFDDRLNIYGFADFTWQDSKNFGRNFASGKLNLYLAKSFSSAWRALAEVRLMYVPSNTTADATDFNRVVESGGISIQRAYLEFDVNEYLTIRAGHWLTPYGIWNVDHGSPAIISAYAPHIIGQRLFPEQQTGLHAFGNKLVGTYKLGYAATLSNGRSTLEATQDPDQHVAIGGRVEVEAPWAGTLKVGISAYGGQSTVAATETTAQWQYNERDYSADAQWDHGPIHLQAEYIYHHRSPVDGDVPRALATMMGPDTNDGTNQGFYVLGAYRFNRLWHIMPFTFYEDWRPLGSTVKLREINVGLNFHPLPNVVLKAMYSDVWSTDTGMGSAIGGDLRIFTTQASWVF